MIPDATARLRSALFAVHWDAAGPHPVIDMLPDPDRARGLDRWRHRRTAALRRLGEGDLDGAFQMLRGPGRLSLIRDWWREGCITCEQLRALLPGWWSDGEPDDRQPVWRDLGRTAAAAVRIETGEPLPPADPLTVFRGQARPTDRLGVRWTLDRAIALSFARRAMWTPEAVVLTGEVDRRRVLGYITDREAAEVIVDPGHVRIVTTEPAEAEPNER
jgi:hypothetical protein